MKFLFNPNYERVIINLVAAGLPASGSAEGDQGFSLRRNGKDKCNASYMKPRSALGGLKVAATPFHNLGLPLWEKNSFSS